MFAVCKDLVAWLSFHEHCARQSMGVVVIEEGGFVLAKARVQRVMWSESETIFGSIVHLDYLQWEETRGKKEYVYLNSKAQFSYPLGTIFELQFLLIRRTRSVNFTNICHRQSRLDTYKERNCGVQEEAEIRKRKESIYACALFFF